MSERGRETEGPSVSAIVNTKFVKMRRSPATSDYTKRPRAAQRVPKLAARAASARRSTRHAIGDSARFLEHHAEGRLLFSGRLGGLHHVAAASAPRRLLRLLLGGQLRDALEDAHHLLVVVLLREK